MKCRNFSPLVVSSLILISVAQAGMKEELGNFIRMEAPKVESGYVTDENYNATSHALFFGVETNLDTQARVYHVAKVGPGAHHFAMYFGPNPLRKMASGSSLHNALISLHTQYSGTFEENVRFFNLVKLSTESPALKAQLESVLSTLTDTNAFLKISYDIVDGLSLWTASIKFKNQQGEHITQLSSSSQSSESVVEALKNEVDAEPGLRIGIANLAVHQ
jgi:hypothetical protein